jgi:hypothetical protein
VPIDCFVFLSWVPGLYLQTSRQRQNQKGRDTIYLVSIGSRASRQFDFSYHHILFLMATSNNLEIWASRIQQELLSLLTTEDDATVSLLPNFCHIQRHDLDLNAATCMVYAKLNVSKPAATASGATASGVGTADDDMVIVELSLNAGFHTVNYPFHVPIVTVTAGGHHLVGTASKSGNALVFPTDDLDWTPSLRLSDVLLHVSLKIKECILRGESIILSPKTTNITTTMGEHTGGGDPMLEEFNEMAKGARQFATKWGERATNTLGKALASTPKSKKITERPVMAVQEKKLVNNTNTVAVGDEINWLEEPWVQAHGVYSCKAIRRPTFVQNMMLKATTSNNNTDARNNLLTSPSQMFRSFAKSARSIMEESFLMVTSTHILELKANKLNMQNIGTVVFCIPIHQLAKLKFRRHESVSLFFKESHGNDDPLVYLCPDSGDAVHQIQTVLKKIGVRGKHTNASAYRAINEAMLMVQDIQTKEFAVEHEPSVERVNEIMDLYRQAAEKLESAGDIRHEEVLSHMKQFLAKPSTAAVLDGSFRKQEKFIPHGEVLESSMEAAVSDAEDDDDDDDDKHGKMDADRSKEEDENFANSIDTLLKDAKEDFGNFHLDDDDDDDDDAILASGATSNTSGEDDLADMAADLDEMMKEADKELAELMNS